MLISVLSDSHDSYENLAWAVAKSNELGAEVLFHLGDIVSPPMVNALKEFAGDIYVTWGNNDGDKPILIKRFTQLPKFKAAEGLLELELGGKKIFANHYPDFAENACNTGRYDLVLSGHTHDYREEKISNSLFLNPGALWGQLGQEVSFATVDLSNLQVSKLTK